MEPKKRKTFKECDELSGWPVSTYDSRVSKHVRNSSKDLSKIVLEEKFTVTRLVALPKPFLVDPDADTKTTAKDRGDIYEAFVRTSTMSIRGMFVNGEPVYGTAHHRCGMVYTGSFVGGIAEGFGEKRAGESVYKGHFHKGERHGRGALLDSKYYRLFMGTFKNDLPDGEVLMILFRWSISSKKVSTSYAIVTFSAGEVVNQVAGATSIIDAQTRSGLEIEEFMELFRMGEKLAEESVARKSLLEANAAESLCTHFGVYPFST